MTGQVDQRAIPSETSNRQKVTIARVADFPPGTRREVRLGRRVIVVFNLEGIYYGLYGLCPHQWAPLSRGRLQGTVVCNADTNWEIEWVCEGEVIVCPGHAMEFHVKTGQAFGHDLKLRTYEVVIEDDQVILLI